MNKNLYIGNLPPGATEEDLKANFSQIGQVLSVNIIRDKFTNQSRGFGFVEMASAEDAQKAVQKFDGGELLGNRIRVSEARPRKETGGPRHGGGYGGDRPGGGRRRF